MSDRVELEREALITLLNLYEQARLCQQQFARAGMGTPEALQRFLGMNGSGQKPGTIRRTTISIPAPPRPPEPENALANWIWIDVKDASPTSVALAILREERGPLTHKEITIRVSAILPQVPMGSISNIGTRLDGKLIRRTDEGWALINPDKAGVIKDNLLWGPPEIFSKQELAAHRRDAVVHILSLHPAGLQIVQVVEQLYNSPWVKATVNKDLVKADLHALADSGRVRRRGNTKKWELPREKKLRSQDSAEASAESKA